MFSISRLLTLAHIATAAATGRPGGMARALAANDAPTPAPAPVSAPIGPSYSPAPGVAALQSTSAALSATLPLHADKIGFYMVPDIDTAYIVKTNASQACIWPQLLTTMEKTKTLLPEVQVRWDNELGHAANTFAFVESMVQCARAGNISMIITASAVDGYDNYWANNDTQPTVTIQDITESPYIEAAYSLMQRYNNVARVETINEVDGIWFIADADNVTGFDLYMDRALATFGPQASRLLGPATAYRTSNIYDAYLRRPNITDISYHSYGGAESLTLVPGKTAWITEYGGAALNPAAILADWYVAVTSGILADNPLATGSIGMLFYSQLTDNGGNRGAWNSLAMEGDHFAFRDWFRALLFVRAMSDVADVVAAGSEGDLLAADNGAGAFAALLWNSANATWGGASRSIAGVSIADDAPLFAALLTPGDSNTAKCTSLAAQQAVGVQVDAGTAVLQVQAMPPLAAVLVSTRACDALAD